VLEARAGLRLCFILCTLRPPCLSTDVRLDDDEDITATLVCRQAVTHACLDYRCLWCGDPQLHCSVDSGASGTLRLVRSARSIHCFLRGGLFCMVLEMKRRYGCEMGLAYIGALFSPLLVRFATTGFARLSFSGSGGLASLQDTWKIFKCFPLGQPEGLKESSRGVEQRDPRKTGRKP
jgi:hypothetical protein